ncbi:stonustoxin subunit beta-like [Alosa alosa]|uniref:stonustoxin subunit beta-like n=1 Tax=Alosa alosa TaxID=278164 RepID=UPI0020154560|nr:stonustoxin subunit beta-like [Alosa alosa]
MSGLRKYAVDITLDPNTAHGELHLENQTVTVDSDKTRPDHPERFQRCQQVLCHEGLKGKAYWEVDWKGRTVVGVAYKSISRDGLDESMLGCNEKSWSLECSTFIVKHQNKPEHLQVPVSRSGRLAVYLDFDGGTLSFYSVSISFGTLSHLHTFKTKFNESLYPGFEVSQSVTIVQVKRTNVPSKLQTS